MESSKGNSTEEPQPQPDYPNLAQAVWLVVRWVLLTAALGLAAGFLLSPKLVEHGAGMAIIQVAATAIVLAWVVEPKGISLEEVFSLSPVSTVFLLTLVPAFLGIHLVTSELDNLIRVLFPMPEGLRVQSLAGESAWGAFLLTVIVAPLTEESIFRGVILRGFLAHYPERKAILYSAILFGVVHVHPAAIVVLSLWGAVVGWIFVRTGSLIPCLFVHAFTNFLTWTLIYVTEFDLPGITRNPMDEGVEFQPLWLDVVGLALACCGLWKLNHLLASRGSQGLSA